MTARGANLPWIFAAGLLVLVVVAFYVLKPLLEPGKPRRGRLLPLVAVMGLSPVPSASAPVCGAPPPPLPKTAPPHSTWFSDGMPPERFRGEGTYTVVITDQPGINQACGGGPQVPCGMEVKACSNRARVVLPNPCDPKYEGQSFAHLFCHETGHRHGWPAYHGD